MKRSSKNPGLRGDIFGGLTAAVIALPLALAFGVAAFAPLGPGYASTGALVGLMGAVFTGFFASLFGGTPTQITGPTAPMTVVVTAFLGESVRAHGIEHVGVILLMVAAAIVLGGVGQIALGLSGGGKIVKYIPYPVVAGFMNGIAVLIFLGQLRPFLGLSGPWSSFDIGRAWVPIAVGTVTVIAVVVTKRKSKTIPASLVGLLVGVVAYLGLALLRQAPLGTEGNDLVVGAIPNPFASLDGLRAMLPLLHLGGLGRLGLDDVQRIVTTAGTLAVLGSIDSLLTSVVADQVTGTRHDARRELVGQGIGNVTSGLFGGLPGAGATVRTLVNIDAGGRTRRAGMIHAGVILLVVLLLSTPAGWIPKAALAGVLFVTAVNMLDQYSLGLIRRSLVRHEFAIIVLVAVVTVVVDLMIAVGLGVAIAGALFVWEQTRKPAVRRRFCGDTIFSRRLRRPAENAILTQHGARTVAYELSGSLFFGTVDQLVSEVDGDVQAADRFIFDFSKVEDMDLSGVRVLVTIFGKLAGQGKHIAVSGLTDLERRSPRVRRLIEDLDVLAEVREQRRAPTLDRALEGFEEEVLSQHLTRPEGLGPIPLSECDGFSELSEQERSRLQRGLSEMRTAEAGAILVTEGTPADGLYLIRSGRVSVVRPGQDGLRLASLGPGAVWGMRALLDGRHWVSRLCAETEVVYQHIAREALEQARKEDPHVVVLLERAFLDATLQRLDLLAAELVQLEEG